jgi:hypothetical protein
VTTTKARVCGAYHTHTQGSMTAVEEVEKCLAYCRRALA